MPILPLATAKAEGIGAVVTKLGKRLIDAAKEAREAIKCDHEWAIDVQADRNVLCCHKCGMRLTKFDQV